MIQHLAATLLRQPLALACPFSTLPVPTILQAVGVNALDTVFYLADKMRYRGNYSIKDLRRDLDGGLGWAHSTESVASYIETIASHMEISEIPTVREAKIRGSFRHTSSQDKTDPKKVVTTSFYKARSGKLATCHAHGDGTWSIAFTGLGREELKKHDASGGSVDIADVDVRVEVRDDILYHHGEMRNKPVACRGIVSMNSDEVHRVHHGNEEQGEAEPKTQEPKAMSALDSNQRTNNPEHQKARDSHNPPHQAYYHRGRIQLSDSQQLLASELAQDGLTKKEERAIFQQLKAMPWEEQERILQQSKLIKSRP